MLDISGAMFKIWIMPVNTQNKVFQWIGLENISDANTDLVSQTENVQVVSQI